MELSVLFVIGFQALFCFTHSSPSACIRKRCGYCG